MNSGLELKGLAWFSLRLRLLRKFAMDDSEPTAQNFAHLLLSLKSNRVTGAWFSIMTIYAGQGLLLFHYILDAELNAFPNFIDQTTFKSVYGIGCIVCILILGFIVGLYPGQIILSRDPEGNILKFFPITARELWWKLVRNQMAAYFLPMILGCISFFIVVSFEYTRAGLTGLWDVQDICNYIYCFVLFCTITLGLMFAGLYSGFRFQSKIYAYILYIGIHFGWVAVVWVGTWQFMQFADDHFHLSYQEEGNLTYLALIVINIVLTSVFIFLSNRIIQKRIYPSEK